MFTCENNNQLILWNLEAIFFGSTQDYWLCDRIRFILFAEIFYRIISKQFFLRCPIETSFDEKFKAHFESMNIKWYEYYRTFQLIVCASVFQPWIELILEICDHLFHIENASLSLSLLCVCNGVHLVRYLCVNRIQYNYFVDWLSNRLTASILHC